MSGHTYCFFAAQYLPTAGGVERYTYNLSCELLRRGNKVIVVTSALPGLPEQETDANGILVLRVPSVALAQGRLPLVWNPFAWKRVCAKLQQLGITRIVVQTRLYVLCVLGMGFAHDHAIPFITIEHGTSYIGIANPVVRAVERFYERVLVRRAKQLCGTFCAVSHASVEWLRCLGIETQAVLYNSVDETQILREPETAELPLRTVLGLAEDAEIVCFVGRLIPEKGVRQLVEAVQRLHKRRRVYLCLAGDGPLYETLRQTSGEEIIVLGKLPYEKVLSLLRQSDIFCLPSDSEGFPTSVLEAVLCRCYVVTTAAGGAKELLCTDAYGTVMQTNNTDEIERALAAALDNPSGRETAQELAYQRFLQAFTWQKTCDALEQLDWKETTR